MVFWAPTELKSNAVLMSPGNLSVAQDQLSRFSGDRDNNTATFVAVVVFNGRTPNRTNGLDAQKPDPNSPGLK